MNEEELMKVEEGLNLLLKKYKNNTKQGDLSRLEAIKDAKQAIRKVALSVAIKGYIKEIYPFFDNKKGCGWKVVDYNDQILYFYSC